MIETDKESFEFFDIDQYYLDQEWVTQPRTFFKFAQRLADAREEYEQAKAAKDVTEAEIDRDVRADPTRFGVAKITEEVVKKTVLLQQDYKDAVQRVIRTKHEVDTLQAVVDALEHRKKALEKLVDLFGMNYFAEPKASTKSARAGLATAEDAERKRQATKFSQRVAEKRKGHDD